jgi:hypothetical protein
VTENLIRNAACIYIMYTCVWHLLLDNNKKPENCLIETRILRLRIHIKSLLPSFTIHHSATAIHRPKFCNSIFTLSSRFFRDTSSSLRATTFGFSARYLAQRSFACAVPSPNSDIKKGCSSLVIALTNLRSINDGMLSITLCVNNEIVRYPYTSVHGCLPCTTPGSNLAPLP